MQKKVCETIQVHTEFPLTDRCAEGRIIVGGETKSSLTNCKARKVRGGAETVFCHRFPKGHL